MPDTKVGSIDDDESLTEGTTMKTFPIFAAVLLAAFSAISEIPWGSCDVIHGNSEHLNPNQGNSALYGRVITPEERATSAAYNHAFDKVLRLLRQSFDQRSREMSKDLDEWVENLNNLVGKLSAVLEPEQKNEENAASKSHKFSRRSVAPLESQGNEKSSSTRVPDSGFSKQPFNPNGKLTLDPRNDSAAVFSPVRRDESQHPDFYPRGQEVNAAAASPDRGSFQPGLEKKLEELLDNIQSRYDNNNLLNLLPIPHLENIGLGLPGQPIRRILHPIFERLAARTKPTDTDQPLGLRFPRKLFADGRSLLDTSSENRETGGIGVHKAVKLGPLSVNFDVGRS